MCWIVLIKEKDIMIQLQIDIFTQSYREFERCSKNRGNMIFCKTAVLII